jgi:hypothetical protein
VPLPEGDRYLGFLFARGPSPEAVEAALREAHRRLTFRIVGPGEQEDEAPCVTASPRSILLPLAPPAETPKRRRSRTPAALV